MFNNNFSSISAKLSYILTYNKYKVLSEYIVGLVIFMVFIATFNNISALSWRSVLLMKETGIPGENQRPVASHGQTLNTVSKSIYFLINVHISIYYSMLSKRLSTFYATVSIPAYIKKRHIQQSQ
jgi:hypothetical protein